MNNKINLKFRKKEILDFRNALLESPAKKYIMKVVVFGSFAKGQARKESDVDLLIVRSNGKAAEEIINRSVYDIILETDIPIEIITCPVEEIFWVDSYFIYNILSYGKEVFSVDKESLKQEAIKGLLNLAKEYLSSAQECAKSTKWRLAVDGAYNACELMAKALLLKKIDDLPGSHGGLVSQFGQIYIKTGKIEHSVGENLHRALQIRNWARYKWEKDIDEKDYNFLSDLAKRLKRAVESLTKK